MFLYGNQPSWQQTDLAIPADPFNNKATYPFHKHLSDFRRISSALPQLITKDPIRYANVKLQVTSQNRSGKLASHNSSLAILADTKVLGRLGTWGSTELSRCYYFKAHLCLTLYGRRIHLRSWWRWCPYSLRPLAVPFQADRCNPAKEQTTWHDNFGLLLSLECVYWSWNNVICKIPDTWLK